MRALWSDGQKCSHNLSQKVRRIRRFTDLESVSVHPVHGNPRTGLLRTFWEQDSVLRSPLGGLCVQGVVSCPTKRAFLCTLYTETPGRAF